MPAIAPAQLNLPVISHAIRKVSLVASILHVIVLVKLLDTLDFMLYYSNYGVWASIAELYPVSLPPSSTMLQLPCV